MSRIFKTLNLISNSRLLLTQSNKRFTFIKHCAGIASVTDKQKELNMPQKPKKPLTAYLRFVNDHRTTIQQSHPSLKGTEIIKKCAADWKDLQSVDKIKYENDYKKEMEQYALKFLKYESSLTEQQKNTLKELNQQVRQDRAKRRLRKEMKMNNKPKRPAGAYVLYVLDQTKVQNKTLKDLLLVLKGSWMNLDEAEKSKYVSQANMLKEQYNKELSNWEDKMLKEGKENLIRHKTLQTLTVTKTSKKK